MPPAPVMGPGEAAVVLRKEAGIDTRLHIKSRMGSWAEDEPHLTECEAEAEAAGPPQGSSTRQVLCPLLSDWVVSLHGLT